MSGSYIVMKRLYLVHRMQINNRVAKIQLSVTPCLFLTLTNTQTSICQIKDETEVSQNRSHSHCIAYLPQSPTCHLIRLSLTLHGSPASGSRVTLFVSHSHYMAYLPQGPSHCMAYQLVTLFVIFAFFPPPVDTFIPSRFLYSSCHTMNSVKYSPQTLSPFFLSFLLLCSNVWLSASEEV